MSKRIRAIARKAQIVADTITGRDAGIEAEMLGEFWEDYLTWIRKRIAKDPGAAVNATRLILDFYQVFVAQAMDDREIHLENYYWINEAIESPLVYQSAAEVVAGLPDLEWLWPEWLPLGLVSLLAAVPGTGKSYLALDLAHRVVRGAKFPDGAEVPERGTVVYVDAENTPVIFKRRVEVWEPEDLARVYLMLPEPERFVINLDDFEDRERLWDMLWAIRPTLLVIDSYGSATLRGENNKEDVQQFLSFLNMLAKDFQLALLIVHHLRKRSGPQTSFMPMTIDSIRGSSHIPAMARNVLGMQWIPTSEHQDENGPRRLWVMKSNITRYPEPIGVFFEPHPLNGEVALLRYGEAPLPYREMTKTDECAEWLEELVRSAEEPISPKEVMALGREMGFNRRMIYRVRQKLNCVVDTEGPRHPENQWAWEERIINED